MNPTSSKADAPALALSIMSPRFARAAESSAVARPDEADSGEPFGAISATAMAVYPPIELPAMANVPDPAESSEASSARA